MGKSVSVVWSMFLTGQRSMWSSFRLMPTRVTCLRSLIWTSCPTLLAPTTALEGLFAEGLSAWQQHPRHRPALLRSCGAAPMDVHMLAGVSRFRSDDIGRHGMG